MRVIQTIPKDFYHPYFVINTPEGRVLKDFKRNTIRLASDQDVEKFGFKSSVSSPVFSTTAMDFVEHGLSFDFGVIDARRVAKRCEL